MAGDVLLKRWEWKLPSESCVRPLPTQMTWGPGVNPGTGRSQAVDDETLGHDTPLSFLCCFGTAGEEERFWHHHVVVLIVANMAYE